MKTHTLHVQRGSAKSLQLCPILRDPMDCSLTSSSVHGTYWSGLPDPSPGDLSNPGIEPASLTSHASAGEFFTTRIIKGGQSEIFSQLKISKEDDKNTYSRSWDDLYFKKLDSPEIHFNLDDCH